MTNRFKLIPTVGLLLRRDNEILLLRRANTGYQDGNYGLVAGHIDGDELATDAAAREAKEEAGVIVEPSHLRFVHVAHRLTRNHPGQERLDMFFEASQWESEITNVEPEKCDDLSWFPMDRLPSNMVPVIRLVIDAITNGEQYSEYTEEPI